MTYDLETIELMLKALSSTFGQEGTRLTDTDWSFVKKSPTIISELVHRVKMLEAKLTITEMQEGYVNPTFQGVKIKWDPE